MDTLVALDRSLFLLINGAHTAFLDSVFYWCSDKWIWAPFYALLFFLVIREFKGKSWIVLLGAVLLIALTDQLSVKLFKDVFMRLRPCHEPALEGLVRTLYGQCGGKYGFVSSHAANTFGLAIFIGMLLQKSLKWLLPFMIVWAVMVSYSRIYLGVHYPGDIIVGAMLGAFIGYLIYRLVIVLMKKINQKAAQ
ncbi:MAG: phosphatase PAP2 family protein [Lentimicrobiaceae bacterium]|nr:phosphatase PAP2 family protein [Lentimicrobiaceae bacterium]